MSSKGTILVTGTNGGLGTAIVGRILKTPSLADNYTGVYTVRKTATAKNLQNALQAAPGSHRHETVELDLSSLAHVRSAAADINSRVEKGEIPPIRALVLNAGYQDHTDLVCRVAAPLMRGFFFCSGLILRL
jgi:NAD(P)-dependent dehydrogenase (short-subunit alcohol dehydrogenase family)